MTLGNRIFKKRKALNLTQEQLAEMMNTSRQAVSKWENDEAVPESDKLVSLAKVFNCSVDELLGNETQFTTPRFLGATRLLKKHGYKAGYFIIANGAVSCIVSGAFFIVIQSFANRIAGIGAEMGFSPFIGILMVMRVMAGIVFLLGLAYIGGGIYFILKGKQMNREM